MVIIGGGDTGADCLGTAHRQGAASVHQFEILPRPPDARADSTPWPTWPLMFRTSSAHEEGGERVFTVNTECFLGDDDGNVRALRAHEVEMVDGRFEKVEGTDFELPCELVLLAMGFVGPERDGAARAARRRARPTGATWPATTTGPPTSTACSSAGDMGRGQSLIVWAIAEGRSCAAAVDRYLEGETLLPAPIVPDGRAPARDAKTPPEGGASRSDCRLGQSLMTTDLAILSRSVCFFGIPQREQRVDQHEQPAEVAQAVGQPCHREQQVADEPLAAADGLAGGLADAAETGLLHPEALPGRAGQVAHVERPGHGEQRDEEAQWVEREHDRVVIAGEGEDGAEDAEEDPRRHVVDEARDEPFLPLGQRPVGAHHRPTPPPAGGTAARGRRVPATGWRRRRWWRWWERTTGRRRRGATAGRRRARARRLIGHGHPPFQDRRSVAKPLVTTG